MQKQVILLTLFSWCLTLPYPAWAGYIPPTKQEPPSDYSSSTGVRSGCLAQADNNPLVILAPQNYVGETLSSHPKFIWFVTEQFETDFRLFEFTSDGQVKQLGKPIQVKSSSGINVLSLPLEQPPLTIGQKYLWQVAIRCPNGNFVLERAEFRVVANSSNLNLNHYSPEKIEEYAQSGFWYEALSESLQVAKSGKLGELGSRLVSSLAQSEIHSNVSTLTNDQRELIQKRIESLEAIAINWR
jgi:hypothetical protein